MLTISQLTAIANLIMLATAIYFSYQNYRTTKNQNVYQLTSQKVIEKIFIPFQQTLFRMLFKKITTKNITIIAHYLNEIQLTIKSHNLSFYLSTRFIFYLENLNFLIQQFKTENTKLNKRKILKQINKQYKRFSKEYFTIQNEYRRLIHLPIYEITEKFHWKLYPNRLTGYTISILYFLFGTRTGITLVFASFIILKEFIR